MHLSLHRPTVFIDETSDGLACPAGGIRQLTPGLPGRQESGNTAAEWAARALQKVIMQLNVNVDTCSTLGCHSERKGVFRMESVSLAIRFEPLNNHSV